MAKKDFKGGFDSLLNGLKQTPVEVEIVQQEPGKVASQADDEKKPETPEGRKQKATRYGAVRATFIVDEEILDKIKGITYFTKRQQKDVINEALRDYIDKYEQENGPVR